MKRFLLIAASAIAVSTVTIVVISRRTAEPVTAVAKPAADAGGVVLFRMEQQWLLKLQMAMAEESTLARQIRSIGRIVPAAGKRAVVSPAVDGIISSSRLPRIGESVARDSVIAVLTQTPSAAEAAQMRIDASRVEAERLRLRQAEVEWQARLAMARTEAARARRLLEQKAYSQRQVETAEADLTVAEATLTAVQEQATALNPPQVTTTYEVRAPMGGTVVAVNKTVGEQVHAGEAIIEIMALDSVWVEAPVFERDLAMLSPDSQAAFSTTAYPDEEFRGRLIHISPIVNEQSRAATATFEVQNPDARLRIGMQANLRLDAREKAAVVLVPKESVLDNEGRKIVYVLRSGEEFQRRDVIIGDEYGGKVAILSGVGKGERVVTQGAYQLKLQELRPANAGAHTHET